jgi:RNAse (barnase) inhibitor barstar
MIFATEADATERIRIARSGAATAVRVIRGWKCGTVERLHDEVGAALQFPAYYGENWDAMDECLRDLSWSPAGALLLVLLDVQSVLPDSDDALRQFLNVLSWAEDGWAAPRHGRESDFCVIVAGDGSGLLRARTLAPPP